MSSSGSDPRNKIPSLSLTQSEPNTKEMRPAPAPAPRRRRVDDKCWMLEDDESMSGFLFPAIDHKDLKIVSEQVHIFLFLLQFSICFSF